MQLNTVVHHFKLWHSQHSNKTAWGPNWEGNIQDTPEFHLRLVWKLIMDLNKHYKTE